MDKKLIERFEKAVRDHAWIGSQPVEDRPLIEAEYIQARAALTGAPAPVSQVRGPKRWLVEQTLPGGSVKWDTFEHEHHARTIAEKSGATVTPLYDHPTPERHVEAPDWIKHDGKGMPIDALERVDVRTRGLDNYGYFDAGEYRDTDGKSWWEHNGSRRDIVEYRLNPRATPAPQTNKKGSGE